MGMKPLDLTAMMSMMKSSPSRILRKWAGVTEDAPNTTRLRPALASLNHRILTLAVILLAGLLPSMMHGSLNSRVVALAVQGAFSLALFALRSQLRSHIREQWELTMQGVLRSVLLPDTAIAEPEMPASIAPRAVPALQFAAGLGPVQVAA